MNLLWRWKMIEMLYIDVEQQPVGNKCLYKNAVKNNLQIMLWAWLAESLNILKGFFYPSMTPQTAHSDTKCYNQRTQKGSGSSCLWRILIPYYAFSYFEVLGVAMMGVHIKQYQRFYELKVEEITYAGSVHSVMWLTRGLKTLSLGLPKNTPDNHTYDPVSP